MNRIDFEDAVALAVDADPQNGAKWNPLRDLLAGQGVLAGGAISNQQAEQRTRIRQVLTKRKVTGQTQALYLQFAVLVLNQDQAQRHIAAPQKVLGSVIEMFEAEHPQLPPPNCLECALILRHDGGHSFVDLALISWGNGPMTKLMRSWYPGAHFLDLSGTLATAHGGTSIAAGSASVAASTAPAKRGDNIIFFGPPGTGKSYRIKEETAEFFDVILTAFHPEYAYSDFVGAYKPVCGSDAGSKISDFTGQQEINRPVVYYTFEPGVLVRAIVRAHQAEGAPVALIVDELNRGDCAAIFGDFMHLLDRAESGRSEYGLDVALPLGAYLVEAGVLESPAEKLFLPANLHIFATINTSDQALYPIDSAFKRRWSWEAIPIAGAAELETVVIGPIGDAPELYWLDFVDRLNSVILHHTENEDKRIGPWFIKAVEDRIPPTQIRNKLLYFLWHDVFRGNTAGVFLPDLRTFEAVQTAFDAGGIPAVLLGFAPPALTAVDDAVEPAEQEAASDSDLDTQT